MQRVAFDHVTSNSPELGLPLELRQSSSLFGSLGALVVVLPTAALLLVPFVLVAGHLLDAPEAASLFIERPGSVIQIVLGLALWGALFGLPLRHLLQGLGRSRIVRISDGCVTVHERSLLGEASWAEPLAGYNGLAHHVRTTVSTTRHELVLVHPNRARAVLVGVADRYSPQDVHHAAELLGQRELASNDLYGETTGRSWSPTPARPLHARA